MQELVTTHEAGQQNGRLHARMNWPDTLSEQDIRDYALREIAEVYQLQGRDVPPETECQSYAGGYWQGYQVEMIAIREEEGINGTAE